MDYSGLDPHYAVSDLRAVLRDLDEDVVDQLAAADGVILQDISVIEAGNLTADDITVLRDLAQSDDY